MDYAELRIFAVPSDENQREERTTGGGGLRDNKVPQRDICGRGGAVGRPFAMAGDQDSYLRVRVPEALQARFKQLCEEHGVTMSKVVRNLLKACCESADAGQPLGGPMEIRMRPGRLGQADSGKGETGDPG